MIFKNYFVFLSIENVYETFTIQNLSTQKTQFVTPQTKEDFCHFVLLLDIRAESPALEHSFRLAFYLDTFMKKACQLNGWTRIGIRVVLI